ncbi:uncharacterized protein LOC133286520 [Gastrolobium bilobum]|uniref:uncharacterized protein LOC133286520 n=1 Tax=Gastrolobium bilobum TaxID=150636 RepID=UPI002AB0C990|nr:uncharacterized protein LOC133286520 [Gastrolobium bilobum]
MKSLLRTVWVVLTAVLVANAVNVSCIPSREFDSMLDTLRVRGYDLFCNAIVTSDLQFDILSYQNQREDENSNNSNSHSFTFFAPTDASLFALDMTQTASSYIDTLRFHVVPRRLSLAELRLLPDGYTLPTLLSQRRLQLTRRPASSVISVGDVNIAFPGMFYGRNVAVHGLASILSLRTNNPPSPSPSPLPAPVVPPISSADQRFSSPRISPSSPESENRTVLGPISRPVPKLVSLNITSRRGSHPPVEAPALTPTPASRPTAVTRQPPAASPLNGRVDAPESEHQDLTVHPPMNLGNSPVVTPAVSPPRYPDSAISLPPAGFSDAEVPAPAGQDLFVRQKDRVSPVGTKGVIETPEKSEALDGIRNCVNPAVGSKDSLSHGNVGGHMQCYAA